MAGRPWARGTRESARPRLGLPHFASHKRSTFVDRSDPFQPGKSALATRQALAASQSTRRVVIDFAPS
jgi:hypothetical protein